MAKSPKLLYYQRGYSMLLYPKFILCRKFKRRKKEFASSDEKKYMAERANYYNKLQDGAELPLH